MKQTRTVLKNTIVDNIRMTRWLEQLASYGVPGLDETLPPWGGRVTDSFDTVEKWLLEAHNIKLYAADRYALSRGLDAAVIRPGLEAEVDNLFDWMPGEFGDEDSGRWSSRRQEFPRLRNRGGHALKIWRGATGVACCSLLPFDGDAVLFNAYGMPLEQMAALYAHLFEREYKIHLVPLTTGEEGLLITEKEGEYVPAVIKGVTGEHLFCEACYKMVDPHSRNGRVYPDTAVVCSKCIEGVRSSRPERWSFAPLVTHRRMEDPDEVSFSTISTSSSSTTVGIGYRSTASTTATSLVQWKARRYHPDSYLAPCPTSDREMIELLMSGISTTDYRIQAMLMRRVTRIAQIYPGLPDQLADGSSPLTHREALVLCRLAQVSTEQATPYLRGLIEADDRASLVRSAWMTLLWDGNRQTLLGLSGLSQGMVCAMLVIHCQPDSSTEWWMAYHRLDLNSRIHITCKILNGEDVSHITMPNEENPT